jgi:hypothetical protein
MNGHGVLRVAARGVRGAAGSDLIAYSRQCRLRLRCGMLHIAAAEARGARSDACHVRTASRMSAPMRRPTMTPVCASSGKYHFYARVICRAAENTIAE